MVFVDRTEARDMLEDTDFRGPDVQAPRNPLNETLVATAAPRSLTVPVRVQGYSINKLQTRIN